MKRIALLLVFLLFADFVNAIPCNVSIFIETDAEIFENNQKIAFKTRLNNKSFDYTIEYWIEDIDGKTIKSKINTTNQNEKSFTPKNIEKDIIIKARIAEIGCGDINFSDNFAEKMVFFKAKPENIANHTFKTVEISFEINKNIEKLVEFASQIPKTTNRTVNIELPKKEYTSNNGENKAKKALPYLFITLTTLLSIVLIWRR